MITLTFEDSDRNRSGFPAASDGVGPTSNRPDAGDVLCSTVSDARFLVTDPGTATGMPNVEDVPLLRGRRQPCSKAVHLSRQFDLAAGQRYVDAVTGLRLLCIWPGRGSLCYQGRRLSREDPLAKRRAPKWKANSNIVTERS